MGGIFWLPPSSRDVSASIPPRRPPHLLAQAGPRRRGGPGALSLSPGSAQAACESGSVANTLCRVTVGGLLYDVTTFTGSYNSNTSKFQTPANGGVMPWWGSSTLANEFATQVGSGLGQPNNLGSPFGPVFAYATSGQNLRIYYYDSRYPSPSILSYDALPPGDSFTWAQVNVSAVPAPLPLFGAGAAFGFSRKLRKRIQESRVPVGSDQPLV